MAATQLALGCREAWNKTPEETLRLLGSSVVGLRLREVEKRLRTTERTPTKETRVPGWKIFFSQFTSPLILILIGASLISFALGERTETVIILAMVFFGGLLSFVQEYRSERALRLLRTRLNHQANVIRNGVAQRIDATRIVVGDIVELELGTIVTADLRLIRAEDLEIDESILTGESMPVRKIAEQLTLKARALPQDQINMAFSGTSVVQGSGLGVVVEIGSATEVGRTALLLAGKTPETEFQKGIRLFGNFLLKVTLVMSLFVAGFVGLVHGHWTESLLFGLAVAVGLSPELLPLIVTINLSRGALAMSKKHVLVKRLTAIEDLGNTDVFCTDKTGTLTVGKLRVKESIDPRGERSSLPLAYAGLCLDLMRNGHASNAIDEAIAESQTHDRIDPPFPQSVRREIISFDFHRRRMSTIVEDAERTCWLITKGALNEMLDVCSLMTSATESRPRRLTTQDRQAITTLADRYYEQGYRLMCVARRSIEAKSHYTVEDEKDLELLGFVLIYDAPKQSAKAALQELAQLHVQVKILTGDNEHVAAHIASQLDFPIIGTLLGDELEQMTEQDLLAQVEQVNLFARITPEHKLRIIQALKHLGHTVGYMGDGVNDAPALRAADVGISFETAVDVAKEAASILLLKKKLSVLADGIREGRRTFVNTMTYVRATISSNFGNMLSVAGAALFLPFIPLLPAQILLLNFLSDIPMLTLWTDRVADEELTKPKRWDIQRISNFMYFFGTISSVADFATFGFLLFVTQANMAMFRSAWFVESILTEIVIIYLVRTKIQTWKNRPSLALVLSSVFVVIVSYAITRLPIGETVELVPLSPKVSFSIIGIVIGYALLTEIGKRAFVRLNRYTHIS